MDTNVSADKSVVTGDVSCESINKLEKNSAAKETKDIIQLSSSPVMLDNGGLTLSPITPDANKESIDKDSTDLMSAFTSPLTMASYPPDTGFYMDEDIDSPSTPKGCVFDPFAPGPENLMLAPHAMKYLEASRSYVARRLNFSSQMTKTNGDKPELVSKTGFDDDTLLEAVYDSLLEAIISRQAEEILAEISAIGSSPDVFKTPPSAPRLTGIADTCPGAPLKPVKKSRNIDLVLCRKLEFDL